MYPGHNKNETVQKVQVKKCNCLITCSSLDYDAEISHTALGFDDIFNDDDAHKRFKNDE